MSLLLALQGAAEVDVSGAVLEGSDSAAGTLDLEITVSGAILEGSDVAAGTVAAVVSISGAVTEGSDAVAGTLTVAVSISGAIQEGSDAAAGTVEVEAADEVDISGDVLEGSDATEGTISVVQEQVTVESGHGWLYKKRGPLPQYYRDLKIADFSSIALPQDRKSNEVAIEVINKIAEIWQQLEENDRHFTEMLAQVDQIQRQVAIFIESRQIYRLVELVETRIRIEQQQAQARRDANLKDDEEGEEFMHLFS